MESIFIHKKILIAPLDWGLGHATRCIPLIKLLLNKECEVIVASAGKQMLLLRKEFPELTFITLSGYNVQYTKNKRFFLLKVLWQTPKILLRIKKEYKWLQYMVEKLKIDAVISDNRFGLYTKKVPCIFLTHQLFIKANNSAAEKILQKLNYIFINRYTECWIPDFEDAGNIGGELSHPSIMPAISTKYIGPLSRFELKPGRKIIFNYIIILSGPEPQRTILEKKILKILPYLEGKIIVIRGLPEGGNEVNVPANCTVFNHLDTTEMEEILSAGEYIISRSGYTTVMEILSLCKKSILIPTPGQTEQEYLARRLMHQQWSYCFKQEDDFLQHIKHAKNFTYNLPDFNEAALEYTLNDFCKNHLKN